MSVIEWTTLSTGWKNDNKRKKRKLKLLPEEETAMSNMGLAEIAHPPSGSPLISFRILPTHWLTDGPLARLLAFLTARPGIVDEVVLFTSSTHPPLPLEEVRQRTERLAEVFPRVHRLGMRAGVNVLSTIGHHVENLGGSLNEPWQRVTGPDGQGCPGSFCPSDPRHIDYVRTMYTLLANADPDFIWLDDDLRLAGHAPVGYTCFCNLCVERFEKMVGASFTRESLVAALNRPFAESADLRRGWLEYHRQMLDAVYRVVEATVHALRPGLELGGMTGDLFWEGHAYARWAESLSGPDRAPVRWRPGGGFYTDNCPLEMVAKAHQIGQQVADLPPSVTVIQSEIENFIYHRLEKSAQSTVVEAAAYMAAGATGAAFNVLSQHADPLDEYRPLLERIAECRPFYERLQAELGRSSNIGVWSAWNQDLAVATEEDDPWIPVQGGLAAIGDVYRPQILAELGIPVCYSRSGATVTALAGCTPRAFSSEELETVFRGGVLMDMAAWRAVARMGLAAWTGVRPAERFAADTIEMLTDHPLNGNCAGFGRDCRQSFPGWQEDAYSLEPSVPGVQILARLVGYQGEDRGPAMTSYENRLGGRVVVMGYYPWTRLHSLAKSNQMKAVCDWLSRDGQPVMVETFARAVVWVRKDKGGHIALVLLNASLDPVESLAVRVRTASATAQHIRMDGASEEICGVRHDLYSGHMRFVMHDLAAWSIHLLVPGN